jgi:hypothetical protein
MKTGKQEHPGASGKRFKPPPIALVCPDSAHPKKKENLTMKLRSNPTNDHSQMYELTFKCCKSGSKEEWLCDLKLIINGQNITAAPSKFAMAKLLLSGDALNVIDTSATKHGNEKNANFI